MAWFDRFRRSARVPRPTGATEPRPTTLAPASQTAPSSVPRPGSHPRFVVLDVETTGLSATTHRVLEIALVTTDPSGRVLDEWTTRLNPQGPVGATHIHGITDADVRHAPLFPDVLDELNQRLTGAALVAHNARFDLAFLRAEYARAQWRLPYLPALCTLDASSHHLPNLPRRRLTDCCHAIGHPLVHAHSALGDARGTAALLAHYLHPHHGVPAQPEHLRMPHDALAITWPSGPEAAPVPVATGARSASLTRRRDLTDRARRNVEALNLTTVRPTQPLVQLVERFALADAIDEGAPTGALAYLEKLAEVLEDGVLTPDEAADLDEVASMHDLDQSSITLTHCAFVLALVHAALADGKVTRAETDEVRVVAALLDVDPTVVRTLVTEAETTRQTRLSANLGPLPDDWAHGEPLRVGDRVVFTGCEGAGRDELEQRSTELGVRVIGTVSSKTAMLVTDGTMLGGKYQKATSLGIRTIGPTTYRVLLQHLQPAATPPREETRRTQLGVLAPKIAALPTDPPTAPVKVATPAPSDNLNAAVPPAAVRAWGRDNGWEVGQRGRLPAGLLEAYDAARQD